MKRKKIIKFTILMVTISMLFGACGISSSKKDKMKYEEFLVIDVFDSLANYQGIQSGWFAKVVKEKFNIELNIIAPNVAGGGDTLYQIRTAAGNVGDIIIGGAENGYFSDLVDAGLLYDMSDALRDKDIMKYEEAIRSLNNTVSEDGIYAIPSEVSELPATLPSEGLELTYGAYLRWDAYATIGYPKMETFDDLLDVLEEMLKIVPYSDSGKKTYAFSLFKDWDGNMMNNAKQPACYYGYDEYGFVLAKGDGTDYQNILDKSSYYIKTLEFLFEANRREMIDPDSKSQNYENMFKKYQDGQILFSFWPWLGQSAYNTEENMQAGKGFMIAPIDDLEIISYGCNPLGNHKTIIGIGSNTKDPERLVDFIDWLYSPEGIFISGAKSSAGTAGIEGLTWELIDGEPVLTDFGVQAFYNPSVEMPEEWGGGTWNEGICELNYKPVSGIEISPDGVPYYYNQWLSVQEFELNTLTLDWKNVMGANNTIEYLKKNNQILVVPGCTFVNPEESAEIMTKRAQCRDVIVDYSWKMIFANSKEEFQRLYTSMVGIVMDLGYEEVFEWDLMNAKLQAIYREEALR